jgi:hypothetical protein
LGGSNCVTFSEFFINKFTDLTFGMADGHNVVKETLAANPGLESGDEPKVWALFSTIPAGVHTGIVLGIHDGKYYVGQASCSNKGLGKGNGVYDYNKCWFNPDSSCGSGFLVIEENSDTSTWFSSHGGKYTFAYPTNVNTQLIEDYINGKGV